MISSKYRISKAFFPKILKNPSISGIYFRVVVAGPISLKNPSFAVIIAKKHAKLAVTRNNFRRIVHEVIRENREKIPHKSLVFMMQKAPTQKLLIKKEITNDIQNLLNQVIKKYGKAH